eukprot:7027207-Alexandrium_andersonii.AAC.1
MRVSCVRGGNWIVFRRDVSSTGAAAGWHAVGMQLACRGMRLPGPRSCARTHTLNGACGARWRSGGSFPWRPANGQQCCKVAASDLGQLRAVSCAAPG